ncbi:MAG: hypothetical protein R3C15_14985 [Thermoleophilia bacterium]
MRALASIGTSIYLGGAFTQVAGQARARLAAVDAGTGVPAAWNPGANNAVNAIAVGGSTLYLGGVFTKLAGQTRQRVGALDASSGALAPWALKLDQPARAVALSGSTVLVGAFAKVGSQPQRGYASFADVSAPVVTVAPGVTIQENGRTLVSSTGTWTGSPAPTFAFQWLRNGVPVAGATSARFRITRGRHGHDARAA